MSAESKNAVQGKAIPGARLSRRGLAEPGKRGGPMIRGCKPVTAKKHVKPRCISDGNNLQLELPEEHA